jgi:hypothetical protein
VFKLKRLLYQPYWLFNCCPLIFRCTNRVVSLFYFDGKSLYYIAIYSRTVVEVLALQHNCSIDEEVCRILTQARFATKKPKKLASYLHQQVMELTSDVELELSENPL